MKKSTKMLSQIALPVILIILLSITAFAASSSYSSTFNFEHGLTTATRNFKGSNISFSATCSQSFNNPNFPQTYSVELWRSVTGSDDYIGKVSMPRDGYKNAKWSSVGTGNYYFCLTKANDGVRLTSGDVKMKNY